MKTLVTGGAGFIGSTLVDRLLAEGHAVDVIDDLSSGNLGNLADARASDGEFSFHKVDICSDSVVELIERRQPEVVYHLAAQADVRVSVRTPALDARINIMGSINVLEGARRAGSRKIAFASSGGTIYGEPDADDLPLTEAQPQKPTSPYGVSKRVVSDYLSVYRQIHGINWTSLALANVFGPRQDPHGEAGVVSIFASRLLAGDSCTIFGSGDQTRDFVFVDDVADAFFRAATRGDDLLINIGTGTETSVNQLYKSMADAADIGDPPSYEEARDGEIDRSCLDAARAKIQLGWEPWTDVATGAQAVIDWERSRQG